VQRGPHPEDRDDGPERDDRDADERGDHRDRGRDPEQDPVHAAGDDVLHQRQLDAVYQRLEQAERPGPVRPDAVLHVPEQAALGPDRDDRAEQQEQEQEQDLDDDQPPRVVPEVGQRRVTRGDSQARHSGLLIVTRLPWPTPSPARTAQPAEFVGSQTTRSGMSAISAGAGMAPRPVAPAALPPPPTPPSAAVTADIRARAARAVPARLGSPSCIRPASSRLCQVASTTRPGTVVTVLGEPGTEVPDARAGPVPARADGRGAPGGEASRSGGPGVIPRADTASTPRPLSSPRATSASGRPRCTSIRSAIMPSICRSVRISGTARAGPNEPGRPSQFTNLPAFSAAAATGSTTSARSVTALGRSSRLTRNRVASRAASAAAGSGRSLGSTPAMTSAPMSPAAAAARMCEVSRPGSAGRDATPQARATSVRAASSATAPPPGSTIGSAPASMAPPPPA